MLQLKLLPGAMLLMLASTLSTNPVSAQTDPASGTGGMQNQMDMNTPQTPSRTNTQPVPTPMQMENQSTPDSNQMQMQQSTPRSTETTTNTVSGTIKSIEGEVVTIEMADGMTKQMRVSTADSQRLNLREGMQVSATVDAQSMASNISVAQASTTTTGTEASSSQVGTTTTGTEASSSQVGTTTTGTEATSSQVGTSSTSTESTTTTEADVSSDTPTTTTTENTRTTVQSTPANRPVRALW